MTDNIVYRKIQSTDLQSLKILHQEFFPVQYSDAFYIDACQEKGIRNGPLFTLIATVNEEIIGFILAQFIPYSECEDNPIVESNDFPISHLFYILTLGVTQPYRRSRVASTLLEHSVNFARRNKGCGAVYLHVLTTNQSAIKFYESNNFTSYKELYGT
jgi:ribosomal protein S18 acetylase RimI-like enzyme